MIDLDAVAEYSINGASGQEPLFVIEHGKKVIRKIEDYTKMAVQAGQEKQLDDVEITSFIENNIGGLLDSIGEANHVYFKNGMKLGASLLLQLLGAREEAAAAKN